jgi:outer membrane protein
MKAIKKYWIPSICLFGFSMTVNAQIPDSIRSLKRCIEYALDQNISIQKTVLNNQSDQVNLEQSKAGRFPSLSASVNQNFSWSRGLNNNQEFVSYSGSSGTNYAVNSGVTLYNGFKTQNSIKEYNLRYQASRFDVEVMKESVSLSVLDAYLQVLYAKEQVSNSEKQIEATTDELRLADERLMLGAISKSDYLQVKSELASEK